MFRILVTLCLLFFQVLVSANQTYELLSSYNNEERKKIFSKALRLSNNECGEVVFDYYQGVYKSKLFWLVKCSNGNEWSLRFPSNIDEQVEIRSCRDLDASGINCFNEVNSDFFVSELKFDRCQLKQHKPSNTGVSIDRCGLISVKNSKFFLDSTSKYIESAKNYSEAFNEGIILLFHFKSESGNPSCSFRQLRYLPNEAGYKFSSEDLANGLMDTKVKVMSKDHTLDLLQRGKKVPFSMAPPPDKYRILSSQEREKETYEVIYEMWSSLEPSGFSVGHKYFTKVINVPENLRKGNAKYFITAECRYTNSRVNVSRRDRVIKSLINSIIILEN